MHDKIFDERFFEFDKNIICREHIENFSKMRKMFFQDFEINNNIVNVNFDEFVRTQ